MQTWGLTDPGNIRQQNQDSYAIVPFARDRVLMIVCDGMGGAKSGNVASSLAVEVFTGSSPRSSAGTWRSSSTSATAAPTILPGKTSRSSRATIPWSPTWSSAAS